MSKIHMSKKDVGRLTIKEFNKYCTYYQNMWDTEHSLMYSQKTYAYLREKQEKDDTWDF